MEETKTIIYQQEGGVARIVLNRPEVYNSFNREMILSLQGYLDRASADKNVRVLVLTGEGKAFCAGQDLGEVVENLGAGRSGDMDFSRVVDEHYSPLVLKIRAMEKPVVAAVNGVAAGAGANLALACDIVVAAESASFIQAFSKIGLIPDCGGTYFLPRLVGFQRASALMMLGDKIPASQAKDMGMIYDWYPDGEFEEKTRIMSRKLAVMPTKGLAHTKELLNQSWKNSLEDQLQQEGVFQQKSGQTRDFAEGVAAFLEKRQPHFKGE